MTSRGSGSTTNLYVTADEFSILGPQFNGAEMWATMSDLVNSVANPHQ